jgi:myosin-5
VHLAHLNEPELVDCLMKRYEADAMYTATGPILLAVNPFRDLPGNYSAELLQLYFEEGQRKGESNSSSLLPLPPHIYKLSDLAYRSMFIDRFAPEQREDQTILVNGESGAG